MPWQPSLPGPLLPLGMHDTLQDLQTLPPWQDHLNVTRLGGEHWSWAVARASWWQSSVIMGLGGFFLVTSVFALWRHCCISMTVSLKANTSFTNLGSYPMLVKAVHCNGVNWSTGATLMGDSIATGSPFTRSGHLLSP